MAEANAPDDEAQAKREDEEIEQRRPPTPSVVYETIRREGEEELERPAVSLIFSGLGAGLSMGFSFIVPAVLYAAVPATSYRTLIVEIGYTIGFLIVVLGRQQLFTENTLTPILPLLLKPTGAMFAKVARLWGLVLTANVAGAAIVSFMLARLPVLHVDANAALAAVALAGAPADFLTTFVRAVFAGWLIALMVWLLPAAEAQRPWIIVLITWIVGIGGFQHIVAGSVETFYEVWTGAVSFGAFWQTFFIPTLLGNCAGGVIFVAVLNYGQIASETDAGTTLNRQ